MAAALQAVPQTAEEPDPPQCDLKNPVGQGPCTELEQLVYTPAMMLRLPELAQLGGESLRVTMTPSLGGRAQLYQVAIDDQGRASLLAIWLVGHPYLGWRELAREEAVLTAREYRRLAAGVDAVLAQPDPPLDDIICIDGPMVRVERHRGGATELIDTSSCMSPRSDAAFGLVAAFACQQVGRNASEALVRSLCASRLRFHRRYASGR